MAWMAFYTGAFVAILLAFGIINNHRVKRGHNNPSGSALWAMWIGLALYGAGSREDWRLDEAFSYIVWGFAFWAWFTYRKRQVKTEI
jgi:hypothetical protein